MSRETAKRAKRLLNKINKTTDIAGPEIIIPNISGVEGFAKKDTSFDNTFTAGSIPFFDIDLRVAQDNTNLFWDNTNKRLGIGTNSPSQTLDVAGSAKISESLIDGTRIGDIPANSYVEFGRHNLVAGFVYYPKLTPHSYFVPGAGEAQMYVDGLINYISTSIGGTQRAGFVLRDVTTPTTNFWTFYYTVATGKFEIQSSGTTTSLSLDGAVVINDLGRDKDFRVESDNNANMLFVDAGANNVGIGTASPNEKLAIAGGDIVVDKTAGIGIKVDNTTPTYGWRDLKGKITNSKGATKPSEITYRNGITQFQFGAGDDAGLEYHIPHDYVPDTDIHLHVHWSHISGAVTGGNVIFTYEITYCKGHNQAAFPATVTGTITGTASTTQFKHIISEGQISISTGSGTQINTDDLEPDGLILCRIEMTTNNMTGATPDPFIHEVDVHYQSTNIGTKQKAPPFYT